MDENMISNGEMEDESGMAVIAVGELSEEEQQALIEEAERLEAERKEALSTLAGSIERKFSDISGRRSRKEREWLDATRLYLGNLSAYGRGTPTKERPHGDTNASKSSPEHNLVKQKCKTAIAQGISMQFAGGDKNWDIQATPSPEIDPIQANIMAEEMELEILDQLDECKYGMQCRKAIESRVNLGTGILKGPVPSKKGRIRYEAITDEIGNTVYIPSTTFDSKPVVTWVDPWFFFPDDSVNCIDDAEFTTELHPMNKTQLEKLRNNPGFIEEAIEELLKLKPDEYKSAALTEYTSLTDSAVDLFKDKYAVIEYHGPVNATAFNALNVETSCEEYEEGKYFGEVWVCQGKVIRLELSPLEAVHELPYAVCTWSDDPGSIFGFGLPLEIVDAQRIANAALAMLLDNSSDSSSPQVVINKSLVEPANGVWELSPGKAWLATDYMLSSDSVQNAFQFFNVPNVQEALTAVLGMAREFAQEESGIPQIAAGIQSPQVGSDSATGLAILQQASTTISDMLAETWDDRITEKIIRRMYHYNMQYNPNPAIKGDFEVDVKSSTEYRNKQLYIRDLEKLSVEAAQNPAMAEVINMQELTRARLSMMHLPTKTIIKTAEQIAQEQEQAAQNPPPPDPALIKAQVEQARLQLEEARLQLEREKMQFEQTQAQQREQWEFMERMNSGEARRLESQARVLEAQLQYQTEMAKLAQRDNEVKSKIMADIDKANMNAQVQKFLAGVDVSMKAQDIKLKQEEAEIKRTQGTGY